MAEGKAGKRLRVTVSGVVQGVGFRPFVFRCAARRSLGGWVRNTLSGAEMEIEGDEAAIEDFLAELRASLPPLARIEEMRAAEVPPLGETEFTIRGSGGGSTHLLSIPPDSAVCPDCLREMNDPADRRHRYPFLNCTQCGPRFSILTALPYDRRNTTMAAFSMCPDCAREYEDPADRRFHAEPVACPRCGPALRWMGPGGARAEGEEALARAASLLAAGGIVAVKGLGGFQLACDACDDEAVARLRERKRRPHKPFAVMSAGVREIARYARISPEEAELLASPAAPIVLLEKREPFPLSRFVAPALPRCGAMVAYTPLHRLLFDSGHSFTALVMTSGNARDEPICRTDAEALERLGGIADGFLLHDREIHNRLDDSVVFVAADGSPMPVRRARGYVPAPVAVDFSGCVFAAGAHLKNTVCLAAGGSAFLSQYHGDLEEEGNWRFFRESCSRLLELVRERPRIVACDLHPDYLSTRYAEELAERCGCPLVRVQHHEAHVASVLAEHRFRGKALGAAFDGTGLGSDGAIWGGEFFVTEDGASFRRFAHLALFPLPGGDKAARSPALCALGLLYPFGLEGEVYRRLPAARREELLAAEGMMRSRLNSPPTSSVGRLFDAVAFLAGFSEDITFEAQAAMWLESLCGDDFRPYTFQLTDERPAWIELNHAVREMLDDADDPPRLASRFHATLAAVAAAVAERARAAEGVEHVALSGGVFQNRVLLDLTARMLEEKGFHVMRNRLVPCNDGGVSLGQAWIAAGRGGVA